MSSILFLLMVDFNSEGAFSSNKGHILELLILGRRDELINTFQIWKEAKSSNSSKEESLKHKLHSILFAIFLETKEALKRNLNEDYNLIEKEILQNTLTDSDILNIFFKINGCLDELSLIKFDSKKKYDSRQVEQENNEKGL